MLCIIAALVALCAYLIGSISSAVLLSHRLNGEDIRNSGSGNAGSTNMLRVYGKKAAAVTLILDILKGAAAVSIAILADFLIPETAELTAFERSYLLGNLKYIAGVFVVWGHDFPIFFKFKGGKGVATSLGVIMTLDQKIGLIVLAAALVIMLTTRYVSLGSVTAALVYPFVLFAFMLGEKSFCVTYLLCAVLLALSVILKHHANIRRLLDGNENKLSLKAKNN